MCAHANRGSAVPTFIIETLPGGLVYTCEEEVRTEGADSAAEFTYRSFVGSDIWTGSILSECGHDTIILIHNVNWLLRSTSL